MADPKGFLNTTARSPTRRPVDGADPRLERGLPRRARPCAAADIADPGRPLHGLRHPVLPPGLPAGQPDPGVERPRLPRRLGGRDRAAARDQQLPGVHRPAVPGAVRVGLRARHQRRAGDDQERRGLDHRPRRGRRAGSRPRRPERLSGKTVAVVGSGPAGLAAAQQLTRAGHTVAVYERADRIGGLLRYGIPEFKMEKRHLDRRIDQMRARGHRLPHRRRRRRRHRPGSSCGSATTRSCSPRARPSRATCRCRAATSRASTRRWSTCRRPTGSRSARSVEGQVTAEGKHVVIIGGGDTGADCLGTAHRQGAASVTQLEIMPRPGEDAPRRAAVADVPDDLPRLLGARGGRRAGLRAVDRGVRRRRRRPRACAAAGRGARSKDGAFQKVEGTEREIPAQLVLLAMGFTGPQTSGWSTQLGVDARRARQRRARRRLHVHRRRASSSPATPDAASRLIVWAIAEGRAAAAGVDTWLTGSTNLPAPIPPTARPLTV